MTTLVQRVLVLLKHAAAVVVATESVVLALPLTACHKGTYHQWYLSVV